jgi:hypothetical protein
MSDTPNFSQLSYVLNHIAKIFSRSGDETLSISTFAKQASLVCFRRGTQDNRPAIKTPLGDATRVKLIEILEKLLNSPPNTTESFIQLKFNRDLKTYENDTVYSWYRDDKSCFGVKISNRLINPEIDFIFRAPASFSVGGDTLTEQERSRLALIAFINTLKYEVPLALMLSTFNMPPRKLARPNGYGRGNGGGGGGGGYNNGYNRGPRSMNGGSEEDLFS